jgi:serine phosphatase RsbU (regulator of sigma subunit)/PAS domain-containing protein
VPGSPESTSPEEASEAGFTRRLLDQTLAEVMRAVDAHVASLYLVIPEEQALGLEVGTGVPAEIAEPWARVGLALPLPVTDAVRQRHLVWISAEGEMARRYPRAGLVLPYHFALAAAPIAGGPVPWGTLLLLWPGTRPPRLSRTERDRIEAACDRMATLLAEAADTGQRIMPGPKPRVIALPRSIAVEPAEALAAVDFAERLPEGCCALNLQGRITFISRKGAELVGEKVSRLVGDRPWEVLPWLNDPVYEDRYRAAVVSRQPTSFTAVRPGDRYLHFQLYPDATGISVCITPTSAGQHLQGRVHTAPPATPTRVGAIYQLMHLAGALTEAVGVRDVVDLVADQILPAFRAKAIAILATEGGRLRVAGHRGYPVEVMERFDGTPLSSSTPAVRAMATGVPSFFASPRELEEAYPSSAARSDTLSAWAFVPLIASGRPVGTCVLAYDQPHAFAPDERAALVSISGLIAQALDRARLYDTKHQLARGLQAGLLPHTLPRLRGLEVAARYLPATRGMDIGGDFYDLIRLSDTTAAAVIGDVQGHNVSAAALMGQVRTAVHAHTTAGAYPDEVLARTNRLLADLEPGLFTSCLYLHLDLAGDRVLMAAAGHPPPLLRHPDGHTEIVDSPPGLLLGIDPAATYPIIEIPLPPGTVLALYTDGLVEAPGLNLENALESLADTLAQPGHRSLEDLADALLDCAQPSGDRSDDTALLLLRHTPAHP